MNTKVTNIHLEKLSQPKIKYIKSLQLKKNRDAAQTLYLEGETLVKDLVTYFPHLVLQLVMDEASATEFQDCGLPILIGSQKELEKISQLKTPKKVNALVNYPKTEAWDETSKVLLLDQIQDPGNLGSIIRSADWYGIKHIICSPNTVDYLNAKVIHSTMISAFRVNIHYQDLAPIIEKHAKTTFGAFMDGTPFEEIESQQLKCLVLGNEGKGISPNLQSLISKHITIPRRGNAESLNVGVAAGILLQHFTKS